MDKQYDVHEMLNKMAGELQEYLEKNAIENPVIVGIHTSGVWVAQQLRQKLNITDDLGELSITFYRDDFSRIGLHPQIKPSRLPLSLEDRHIILVDDVLYSGRTIRAAMNELFDYGRPASILLAVLIDRGGHELPIAAQVVGMHKELPSDQFFKLSDPETLALSVVSKHA